MIRKTQILLLFGMLSAFCACPSPAADSLVLTQARLGNIFLSTETVEIRVQITGDPVDAVTWTAKDFFGVPTTGTIPGPLIGPVSIAPALGRLGYFDLRVTALRGGNPVSADTTFAVVAPTPTDVRDMHDSAFGAMTHVNQGWTPDILRLLARGGVVHFRDEHEWKKVERALPAPPTYDFTQFEPFMSQAATLGLKPLIVLDFAHPDYDEGFTPYTDNGRAGYANYANALLAHNQEFNTDPQTQIDTVAIWNEYNGSFAKGPVEENRPLFYAKMLKKAYMEIKVQNPDVRIIGGACVPVPLPWYEKLFAAEIEPDVPISDRKYAQDYMDVLDAHPYRSIPEGVELNIASLQNLSASYNHGNGPKPIWATECGAPDPFNQGRQNMARYLVRLMTLMLSAGVERAYWYLAYDYDGYATGLVRSPTDPLGPYVPTSAYSAYANLIRQLFGASYTTRENTDARTRFYRFDRDGTDVRVAWSTLGTAQLVLTTSTPLTRIDIMGESVVLHPTSGQIALTVDENPFYLIGPINSIREIGRDVLVADSVRDYSGTQGTTNGTWYYGDQHVPVGAAYNVNGLEQMNYAKDDFDSVYKHYSFSKLDSNGGHPGVRQGYAVEDAVWVVRRWHSNVAANARISGTVVRASAQGNGTGALIYVDGNLVYSALVGPSLGATVHIDFTTPILVGSKVDFIITPGPKPPNQLADVDFDYVDFRGQISVPQLPPTTFTAWQEQNFTAAEIIDPTISGDNAAPAGDGVDNLVKYAASVPPKTFAAAALPSSGQVTIDNKTYLTLSYRKAAAPQAQDLIINTQLNAGDLASDPWENGGVPVGLPATNPDGTQTVTVRDTVPITPETPRRFMRLRIVRP